VVVEKSWEVLPKMNRIHKFALSLFSAALLAGVMVSLPSQAATQAMPSAGSQSQEQQQLQSVSGKITAVSGKTFTLAASSSSPSSPAGADHFQASPSGQSMTFTIDDNTTVSGKLAVGANADVTYRTQGGQNIAVSVRVS
jgi:hypothetical protein